MRHFVRIVNRGTYTNAKKAAWYVARELAVPVDHNERGQMIAIQMLEAAELVLLRSVIVRETRVANTDDGIARRWVKRESGERNKRRVPVMQLRAVQEVGTGDSVQHWQDPLTRRHRQDPGHSIPLDAA